LSTPKSKLPTLANSSQKCYSLYIMPARNDLSIGRLNEEVLRYYGLNADPKSVPKSERKITSPEDVIRGLGETELSKTVIVLSPDDGAEE
jgi:hypothetical protein